MQVSLKNIFLLFIFSFLIGDLTSAQQTPASTDSTSLYKNIETYSRQSKFKTIVYRLIFKPVTPLTKNKAVRKKTYKNLIQKPYGNFEGKIIRNINAVSYTH